MSATRCVLRWNMRSDATRFDARDACSNAQLLSLLVGCAAAVSLAFEGGLHAPRPLVIAELVELTLALAAFATLVITRRRPSAALALALSGLLIALYFVRLPVGTVAWHHAGRPWEAMTDLHFACMAVALAVPGSFAIGVFALTAFAVEGIAIHLWLLRAGTAPTHLIAGEPTLTIVFIIIGFTVLFVRRQRRALTHRHLLRSAEALTLTRLSTRLREIAGDLGDAARALSNAVDRVRTNTANALAGRIDRALGQIGAVREGLEEAYGARPPTGLLDEEEQALYARDAHNAALTLTVAVTIVETLAVLGTRGLPVERMRLFFVLSGSIAAASTLTLLGFRRRPSERVCFAIFLVNVLPAFLQYWYSAPAWAGTGQAFDPLAGNKTFLVLVPLIVPRRVWVAIGIEVAMTTMSITLYFHHHFDAARDRSPLAEPWTTALYLLVGLALVATRENRRLMSVRLLRADREVAALLSNARASLRLLDQLGSPLQVLAVSLAQLDGAGSDERQAIEAALERLIEVSRRVPAADARALAQIGVSV